MKAFEDSIEEVNNTWIVPGFMKGFHGIANDLSFVEE